MLPTLAFCGLARWRTFPYNRDRDGLPRGWIKRMKRTIRTLGWRFNANRMVMDYVRHCYVPAAGGLSSDMSLRG